MSSPKHVWQQLMHFVTNMNVVWYDNLTGIYNRSFITHMAEIESERAMRYKRPLSIALIDIDDFKKINDTYGHSTGDGVLIEIAKRIKGAARSTDMCGRYAGDEFLVLLPETPLSKTHFLGARLLKRINEAPININGRVIDTTISVGVATIDTDKKSSAHEIINKADEMLYKAKGKGKNTYRVYEDA